MSAGRPRTTVRHGGRTMARLVCVSALGRMTHTRDVVLGTSCMWMACTQSVVTSTAACTAKGIAHDRRVLLDVVARTCTEGQR